MKKFIFPLLALFFFFGAVFVLRFSLGGNEDTWLCVDGQWQAHGQPDSPQPTGSCPGSETENEASETNLIGGQTDEHGCLGPAGYAWDSDLQVCLRSWEVDESQRKAVGIAVDYLGSLPALTLVRAQSLRCPGCFELEFEFSRGDIKQSLKVEVSSWQVKQAFSEQVIDEENGSSLKIPFGWELLSSSAGFPSLKRWQATDGSVLEVSIIRSAGDLTQFLQDKDDHDKVAWEGQPVKKILSQQEVSISGYSGLERKEDWLAADFTALVTYLQVGSSVYEFSLQPGDVPYGQTEVFNSYSQVLNSLRPLAGSVSTTLSGPEFAAQ